MGADCIGADRIASPTEEVTRRTLIAGAVGALALPIASPALLVPSPAQARGIAQGVQPDDELFMRMAIAEAARGDYPFGSVIVRDRKVMAKGRNLGKQEKDPTAHGEMVAIRHFLARYGPDKLKGRRSMAQANPAPCAWARSCGAEFPAWSTAPRSPRSRPGPGRLWSPTL